MKIGKRVLINSVRITEFDLVTLGDDSCVDDGATICCHVFEDGNLVLSSITLHANALVQPHAVVNPCEIGERATVGPFSCIAPGTTIDPNTIWRGSPAVNNGYDDYYGDEPISLYSYPP